jgi:hypothetical protein
LQKAIALNRFYLSFMCPVDQREWRQIVRPDVAAQFTDRREIFKPFLAARFTDRRGGAFLGRPSAGGRDRHLRHLFLPLAFVLPTVLIESQSGLNYIVVTGE